MYTSRLCTSKKGRDGFTLIELLVVITIIGMLMGMLFPAIGQVRETMRMTECKNRLKQIGIAMSSFDSAHGTLPPGVPSCNKSEGSRYKMGGLSSQQSGQCLGPHALVAILQQMGETALDQAVSDCMDVTMQTLSQCSGSERFGWPGTTTPQSYRCPSDEEILPEFRFSGEGYQDLDKGNYAVCFGLEYMVNRDGRQNKRSVEGDINSYVIEQKAGAFEVIYIGYLKKGRGKWGDPDAALPDTKAEFIGKWKAAKNAGNKIGHGAFPDGPSKTILASEILGVESEDDNRGAWFYPGMGGSAFTTRTPPNADGYGGRDEFFDNIPGCDDSIQEGDIMFCKKSRGPRSWAAARSEHPQLVNVLYGDFRVVNIDEGVDPRVWQAMGTRNSGTFEKNLTFPE